MGRGRFVWKVFGGMALVILVTIVLVDFGARTTARNALLREIEGRLTDYSKILSVLAADSLQAGKGLAEIQAAADELEGTRITLVALDGSVLFDSHEAPERMNNHAQRPEILFPGTHVTRISESVKMEMMYCAKEVVVDGEQVATARIAVPIEDVDGRVAEMRSTLRGSVYLAGAVAMLMALWFARRVSNPIRKISGLIEDIGQGDTSIRVPSMGGGEIGQLGQSVNRMTSELEKRMQRIDRDHDVREAILSGMAEGLVGVDSDQRVVLINSTARELLLDPTDDPRGLPIWEVSRIPEVIETVASCVETGEIVDSEAVLKSEAGGRNIGLTARPLIEDDGSTWGCVLVLRDQTELRRLESVRKDFVANVSHELKTPLTSMRGYLETILDDPDMEPRTRSSFLEKASASTDRLVAIVSDLLTIARLDAEASPVMEEHMDLLEIVERAVRDCRPAAETREISIELEPLDGPTPIRGDRLALGSAVSNLIDNAIKYSPEGSKILLRLIPGDGKARFEVSDQGPGIPAAEQERVFERFYRVDKNRSRALGGTGLGLSIVKNVAEKHGGTVQVKSREGGGATFILTLPQD